MTAKKLAWLATILALLEVASAADTNIWLRIGDLAPKLQISAWVQGEPVQEFESNKVYILAFWTVHNTQGRLAIRHLEWLHKKFKDHGVIVIGQSVYEGDPNDVKAFLQDMSGRLTYRVALDTAASGRWPGLGPMYKTWMQAALERQVPIAFVVNKHGRIVWIDQPNALKERVLQQVIDDSFDIERAAADKAKRSDPHRKLDWAMEHQRWDVAEALLPELAKAGLEAKRRMESGRIFPRSFVPGPTYMEHLHLTILLAKGDYDGALQLVDKATDEKKADSELLKLLVGQILRNEAFKEKDLPLLEKIASRANVATQGKDTTVLDTLARLTFMQGNAEKAVELQEQAVKLAKPELKSDLQVTLESYKNGMLPKP